MNTAESSEYHTSIDGRPIDGTHAFIIDEKPVLRIWGSYRVIWPPRDETCEDLSSIVDRPNYDPPDYVVQLDHHDRGDSDVDLSRQDWHMGLNGLSSANTDIDSKTAARHFPLRLDRFCEDYSWEPYETIVYHEIDSKTWIPVMLILFNEARPSRGIVFDHNKPGLKLLRGKVSDYLNKFQRKDGSLEVGMGLNYITHHLQPSVAKATSRGRRKRAARRHAGGNPKISVAREEVCTNALTHPLPSTNGNLRGRLRRLQKRHQLPNTLQKIYLTTRESIQPPITLPVPSSTSNLMSTESLTSEAPFQLPQSFWHLPIIEASPRRENSLAMLVWRDAYAMQGFVIVPKPEFDYGSERMVMVEKVGLAGKISLPTSKIPSTYWNKFSISENSFLRQKRGTYHSQNETLATSLQWSYNCNLLWSPDHTLGPFADEKEYTRQYFLPNLGTRGMVETEPDATNEIMRWSSESDRMPARSSVHLDILDDDNQQDAAASVWPPNIPRSKPMDPRSMKETVKYFTLAMMSLENMDSSYSFLDVSSFSALQDQSLQVYMNEPSCVSDEENLDQVPPGSQLRTSTCSPDDSEIDERVPERVLMRDDDESMVQVGIGGSPQPASSEDYPWGFGQYESDPDTYSIKDGGNLRQPIFISWDLETGRDLFYLGNYLTLIPLSRQERHVRRLRELACNATYHADIRAHAVFQFALCLLTGFGVPEDRELGLSWFWRASVSGSQVARAVVQRLFIAYGEKLPESGFSSQWLAEETRNGSAWASAELTIEDSHNHAVAQNDDGLRRVAASIPIMKDLGIDDLDQLLCQLKEDPVHSSTSMLIDGIKAAARSGPWFFTELLEWACRGASVKAFSHLFQFWNTPTTTFQRRDTTWQLHRYLCIALQAGRADIAHVIMDHRLARQERLETSGLNHFFFLLDIENDQMDTIVQKITRLGEDPNETVRLDSQFPDELEITYSFRDHANTLTRKQHLKLMPNGLSITPLRWAIMNHKASAVKALLSVGAIFPVVPSAQAHTDLLFEAFAPQFCQVATLGTACYDLQIIQLFLDRHGHQSAQTVFAETPLGLIVTESDDAQRRIRLGKLATREYLFPVLARLRSCQSQSDPELFRAAAMNGHLEVVEYLIKEAGVDIECRCSGLTPLHTATLYGRKTVFTYLLDNGADTGAVTTRKGISLAHLIFWKPKPAPLELYMLDRLAQAGADILGSSSPFGSTASPLHLAVLGSRVTAVGRLLELGASRSETMNEEVMPFILGAEFTHWGKERSKRTGFQEYGTDDKAFRTISIRGYTPVGLLLRRWDMHDPKDLLRLLKLLCSESHDLKDFYTRPANKETVLHTIACYPFLCGTGIWEYVLQQGSASGLHINVPDAHGDTPLHWAQVMRGSTDGVIVNDLVALGADQDIRNMYNMTPKDIRLWFYIHPNNHEGHRDNMSIGLTTLPEHTQGRLGPLMHGMVYNDIGSVHDNDFSRLWSTICNGVIIQRAWDFDSCDWLEFDDEYFLRALTHAHDYLFRGNLSWIY